MNEYVMFEVADKEFVVALHDVDRVLRAAFVTPLPETHAFYIGLLNVHGKVIKVISIRKQMKLPEKDMSPDDQFILLKDSALWVDRVKETISLKESTFESIGDGKTESVKHFTRINGKIVFVYKV